ncbi:hypothetical protein ABEB36_007060 [Hypothenemus hampei]|uniref:Tubulin delta chain n=1 Tax=Hypothenemus hampei TaxID=57062 RepID=A0ABD1ET77_HYPHA
MSILSLQFGQCGNQVCEMLYSLLEQDIQAKKTINQDFYAESTTKWFDINNKGHLRPRSIFIDTETKVVKPLKSLQIVAKAIGGSANNWACGYAENSRLIKADVLNLVRQEVEKCDRLTNFLTFYSLSGGTGSGVGSAVIEELCTDYPNKILVNCAILPYTRGEIATQSYNSLLNLAKLYPLVDSTILIENERLHHQCKYSIGLSEITYNHLNALIAQQISAIFQPLNNTNTFELIKELTPHKNFKFLQIRTEPNKNLSDFECAMPWVGLWNGLNKQNRFDANFTNQIIASTLIARGDGFTECNLRKTSKDFVKWLSKDENFKILSTNVRFLSYKRHLSQILNGSNIVKPLNFILEDAWKLFTHAAYIHHYKKFGVDEHWFLESFQVLENVLHHYKTV